MYAKTSIIYIVLQEIEEEDRLWQVNKKRRNRKQSSNQATESTLNNPQSPSEVVKDKARQDAGSNEAGEKVGDEHLKKIPRAFY